MKFREEPLASRPVFTVHSLFASRTVPPQPVGASRRGQLVGKGGPMYRRMRAMSAVWMGLVVFLAALAQAPQIVDACGNYGKDLVGWWKLDDGVGTVAVDSSGLGNHGTVEGEASFTTDSLLGTAVDVWGSTGSIVVPYHPSLEPAVGTIQVWVKVANPQDSDIVTKTTDFLVRSQKIGSYSVYGLRVHLDGRVSGFIANDAPDGSIWTKVTSAPGLITLGEWHLLAMKWDDVTLDLFVDGTKHDSQPYVPIPGLGLSYHDTSQFGLAIGTFWDSQPGTEHSFIGQIDDVRVYARARPDREIWADYRSKGKKPAKPPGHFKNKVGKKPKKGKSNLAHGKWNKTKKQKQSGGH